MTSGDLSQVLKDIREHFENKKPEPYYNEQGYVKNPTTMGTTGYWPQPNPNDLPPELNNWQDNILEII